MLIFKNEKECPYRNNCKYLEECCSKMCITFSEIDLMFHNANIPKLFQQPFKLYPQEIDLSSYEALGLITKNIKEIVDDGFVLYIQSEKRGNGKTSWGIKILQNYLHQLIGESGSKSKGIYVDVSDFIKDVKTSFDEKNKETSQLEENVRNANLLVLDGIDEFQLSEWERKYFRSLIKNRINNKLSTIFIGNNLNNKLILMVGEDLKYYIQDTGTVITLYGERGDVQ